MWVFKLIYIASIIISFGLMYWGNAIDARRNDRSEMEEFKKIPFITAVGLVILSFVPMFNFVIIALVGIHCFEHTTIDVNDFNIGDFIDKINKKK